jgi:hypothetical protein
MFHDLDVNYDYANKRDIGNFILYYSMKFC